jgi:hypothetical protein
MTLKKPFSASTFPLLVEAMVSPQVTFGMLHQSYTVF